MSGNNHNNMSDSTEVGATGCSVSGGFDLVLIQN